MSLIYPPIDNICQRSTLTRFPLSPCNGISTPARWIHHIGHSLEIKARLALPFSRRVLRSDSHQEDTSCRRSSSRTTTPYKNCEQRPSWPATNFYGSYQPFLLPRRWFKDQFLENRLHWIWAQEYLLHHHTQSAN
ncbi:hypothetical protein GY45DRAFT_1003223 [Cubamyces sp. BRFM 1775]|nr:hypothetical protein GY45DRAFT_1003223 [Cubamyces sp. BRFM 1775]